MNWNGLSRLLCLLWFAAAGVVQANTDDDEMPRGWREQEMVLPPAAKDAAWQPFYVSAATENRFFIDRDSLSVGEDGVVRYVLKVETPEGARNVTFEGMRCETRELRVYAIGRRDGSWVNSRNKAWERIRDAVSNRHHAALFLDYFCPGGVIVRTAQEANDALRRGGHPSNQRW